MQELPLRWIFLDLNSYFASVEQAEDRNLRGKPIGVAGSHGDSATIVAASYEAKAYGIKTGTKVGEAKRLCPDFINCPVRPPLYVHYHERILEAVESILPVHKVCSIDEMKFRLLGKECAVDEARALGLKLKNVIRSEVADNLTSSVGIATNSFLAKFGTELEKPDGLVVIQHSDLPDILYNRPLMMFTGINKRMKARLNAAGIFTSQDMVDASAHKMIQAFGSVVGERWHYLLRGHDMEFENENRKSLGHSNVLAPEFRNDDGCRGILLRLLTKACARLRASKLYATRVTVTVVGKSRTWSDERSLDPTQDTHLILKTVLEMWESRNFSQPTQVSINFPRLVEEYGVTGSLFAEEDRSEVCRAADRVNQKFGKNSVYLGGLSRTKTAASEKIAFNKTWLFPEGKDDNKWKGKKH